ncbi:hypothetical protein [Halonotius roseus]|uniref:hypothetical protein n=1 Tax=Halonotius roseus TaxID=2511997 RepID=UPI00163CA98E|nr:hypothetical protein [Halonotius roseus]
MSFRFRPIDVVSIFSDRCRFGVGSPTSGMDDSDLLGIVLGGIALMMFVTGIVLVV